MTELGRVDLKSVTRLGALVAYLDSATLEQVTWGLDPVDDKAKLTYSPKDVDPGVIVVNKTELQVWVDNALLWWGPFRKKRGNSKVLSVDCEGSFSEFSFRYISEDDLAFVNVEQMSIGTYLVNYAQSAVQGTNPGLNIGIAGYTNSGVLMSREYLADRKQSILSALQELSSVDDGFDQSVEVFGNGTKLWTPHYPQRGSIKNNMYLELGRNVVDYDYEEDGGNQATKADATGGTVDVDPSDPSAGRTKQSATFEDTALSTEYGVRVGIVPSGARSDLDWLQRRAEGKVALDGRPAKVTGVYCRRGVATRTAGSGEPLYPDVLTGLWPGDYAPVRIDEGEIQVSGLQRIQTKTWYRDTDITHFEFTSDAA